MAIDKIIPRFLNLDKDERLLAGDEMTDALNVTMSSDNSGLDESIIKNIKGFNEVDSSNNSEIFNPSLAYTAIGSVSDHQNGDVYWFINASGNDHMILKQDLSANSLNVVYRGSWLNFNKKKYVKGDVVTLNIAEEKDPQTILYFTDDRNEPRKINVTRALGTDYYDFIIDEERDYAWSSVRAAQNNAPTFVFVTDSNYTSNNFVHNPFQFALQYIYKDGEESAIGVYSKMAVCPVDLTEGLPNFDDIIAPNTFNVCEVRLNLKENIYDLKRVRLIARRGNSGEFFTIDEFDPYVDKTVSLGGSSDTIYDSSSQTYTFRNDVIGTVIDSNTVNKLYDNVPYKARTQAIAANRLIYANYSEGRENFDIDTNRNVVDSLNRPGRINLTVDYNDIDLDGISYLNTSATISDEIEEAATFDNVNQNDLHYDGDLKIKIDLPGLLNQAASPTVPAGTVTKISFDFAPEANKVQPDPSANNQQFVSGLIRLNENTSGVYTTYEYHNFEQAYLLLTELEEAKTVSITNQNTFDVTHEELANQVMGKFAAEEVELTYNLGANQGASTYTVKDTDDNDNELDVWGKLKVKYKFDTATQSSGTITIHARISSVSFADANLENVGNYTYNFSPSSSNPTSLTSNSNIADKQTWTHLTGIATAHYLSNEDASFHRTNKIGSFKAGSHHKFGIVYYDQYNRSGFVNDLGSVYVKWPGERSTSEYGSASVNIALTDVNGQQVAPQWADRYQIVYSGAVDIDDYVQYVAGGGFPVVFNEEDFDLGNNDLGYVGQNYINVTTEPAAGEPDFVKCQLFVNIDTLDIYRDEKGALRDYSFTKGDKLRVVSYESATNDGTTVTYTTNYPIATDGSIIEFDVVDYVTVTSGSDEQLHLSNDPNHTGYEKFIGNFLVLEHPHITGGAQYDDNGTIKPVRYEGFDFFSVAKTKVTGTTGKALSYRYRAPGATNANNGTAISSWDSGANYWGQRCVVEIYTPSQKNEAEVFYEIGVGGDVDIRASYTQDIARASYGGDGSSQVNVVLDSGDVTFRPVPMKGPVGVSDASWNWDSDTLDKDDHWLYFVRKVENKSLSDYYDSDFWDRGRAHVKFLSASENRIGNGFIYSDAYTQGSENLSFSSFNPSLANFYYLEAKFGDVGFINSYSDDLVAIQSNKFSLVPINKNIIEYASGSANVAVSTDVFSNARYSAGDFGCGSNGESALVVDNDVAFYDPNRHKALLFSGGQLTPISDKGVSSFFTDEFIAGSPSNFVTGYDPDSNLLYFTGAQTIGYNLSARKWQSRYSFIPTFYAYVEDTMCAFYDGGDNGHVWTHDNETTRNSVFGSNVDSIVEVVSKLSPSRVKVYNALSYESSSGNWDVVGSTDVTTNLDQETGGVTSWRENEGSYYAPMPRDKSSNSTSHKIFVGTLSTTDNITFTSTVNLSHLPIPLGVDVTLNGETVEVISVGKNKLTLQAENASVAGSDLYLEAPDSHGDPIRGHYAKIKLTLPSADAGTKQELYCINTHIADSKLHHALGDQ